MEHSGSPLPGPAQRRHWGQQLHAGHTPPHSPFIHPVLPPPPGSATSLPPRPGTPHGRCQHTAPHASIPHPQVPSVLPGAELPGHPALSAAANYPPRKMHFKLVRAHSRRLPSNAPATASKCQCCVSLGSGGEPRERWLLRSSRHSWLLPAAPASPPSPGYKRAGGKGKSCLRGVFQHQQSPTGSCQTEPLQALATSGRCYRDTFVPLETSTEGRAAFHCPQLNQHLTAQSGDEALGAGGCAGSGPAAPEAAAGKGERSPPQHPRR